MATIDTVTDDRGDSATPGGADIATGHDLPPVGAGERSAERLSAGAERRSLLVPVLSTAVGALIAGVLGLAVLGFNTLRDDIRGLDGDIDLLRGEMIQGFARVDERFAQVDQRFAQIDERFARIDERLDQINAVLLDHAERLARIETRLGGGESGIADRAGDRTRRSPLGDFL